MEKHNAGYSFIFFVQKKQLAEKVTVFSNFYARFKNAGTFFKAFPDAGRCYSRNFLPACFHY